MGCKKDVGSIDHVLFVQLPHSVVCCMASLDTLITAGQMSAMVTVHQLTTPPH